MAWRLYTRAEFESELRLTFGLRFIGLVTGTLEQWRTPKGNMLLIRVLPDDELYPHPMVGTIGQQVQRLDGTA